MEQFATILGSDFYTFLTNIKEINIVNFILSNWWWLGLVAALIWMIFSLFNLILKYLPPKYKANKIQLEIKTEFVEEYQNLFLQITNNEEQDLRDCFLFMNTLVSISDCGNMDEKGCVNPDMSMFSWPLFISDKEKIVRQKTTARVNIGKFNEKNDQIYLTFENGDSNLSFLMNEKYFIEIVLNGKLGEKNIDEIIVSGYLTKDQYVWTDYGATITTTKMVKGEIIKTVEKEPDRQRMSKIFSFKEGNLNNNYVRENG